MRRHPHELVACPAPGVCLDDVGKTIEAVHFYGKSKNDDRFVQRILRRLWRGLPNAGHSVTTPFSQPDIDRSNTCIWKVEPFPYARLMATLSPAVVPSHCPDAPLRIPSCWMVHEG